STGARLELEDAEPHGRDELAVVGAVVDACRDEVPDAEAGGLLVGDGLDDRRRRQVVAEMQVAVVLLLAVRRDYGSEAGVVEHAHALVARVAAGRRAGPDAPHHPRLD